MTYGRERAAKVSTGKDIWTAPPTARSSETEITFTTGPRPHMPAFLDSAGVGKPLSEPWKRERFLKFPSVTGGVPT
jgi:hypothetical protein